MKEEKLAVYIAAYEAWWRASEIYECLVDRANKGDQEAAEQLQVLLQALNALEVDYLQKKASLAGHNMDESVQSENGNEPRPQYKIKAIFQWLFGYSN